MCCYELPVNSLFAHSGLSESDIKIQREEIVECIYWTPCNHLLNLPDLSKSTGKCDF